MSIGLKRGTVKLVEHSAQWSSEYSKEKSLLQQLAGNYISRIEHIGSTSVPGLIAKPVIDIGIEVSTVEALEKLINALPTDVYTYFGERDIPGDYFVAKGAEVCRTHYIHISLPETGRFDAYVKFRDSLRNDTKLAQQYGEIKWGLSSRLANDRKHYTQLKGAFVMSVLNS